MEIQYSQLKINHLNDTPSTKAAGGGIFSGVFQQGSQGTSQGQEDFELSWYLFFQQAQPGQTSWVATLTTPDTPPTLHPPPDKVHRRQQTFIPSHY